MTDLKGDHFPNFMEFQNEFDPISMRMTSLDSHQNSDYFPNLSHINQHSVHNILSDITNITNKPYLRPDRSFPKIDPMKQHHQSNLQLPSQRFDQTLNLEDEALNQHLYQLNSFLEDEDEVNF